MSRTLAEAVLGNWLSEAKLNKLGEVSTVIKPTESLVEEGPSRNHEYELLIAMGYDGKVVVLEAPEEFKSFACEGSGYFDGGIRGPQEAGVYRLKVVFRVDYFEGETPETDCYFEETAWSKPGADWIEIGKVSII